MENSDYSQQGFFFMHSACIFALKTLFQKTKSCQLYLQYLLLIHQTYIPEKMHNDKNQKTYTESSIEDRIKGALWGAVLGDVIGAVLQFGRNIDEKKIQQAFIIRGGGVHKLEPGQPTDDSQLGYAIGNGLVRGKGELNLDFIAQQMGNWFLSKPIDVGGTIRKSVPKACNMQKHQAYLCRKAAKQGSQQSQSNGTLMSITPLAIWCHRLEPQDIFKAVRQYTILVHPNNLVILSNTFYALMLTYLLKCPQTTNENDIRRKAFDYAKGLILQKIKNSKQKEEVQFATWISQLQNSFTDPQILGQKVSPTKNSGWVRVAFSYAIYQLMVSKSFKESLTQILRLKGDTDTNACIAGGLIGAYYGYNKLDMLEQIEKIEQWRPKKVKRPNWLVPGLVIDKFAKVLLQISPSQLKIVGGQQNVK